MNFAGRSRELAALQSAYAAQRSEVIQITGRRRIGKTELLLKFATGKPLFYFSGKPSPAPQQIAEFMRVAARTLSQGDLAHIAIHSWADAFTTIANHLTGTKKWIIAFDNAESIFHESPGFASALSALMEKVAARKLRVLIILTSTTPLPEGHLEATHLSLGPLSFGEVCSFNKRYTIRDHALVYGLVGGIPGYLARWDFKATPATNIQRLMMPGGILFDEVELLLAGPLRELAPYTAVLSVLAQGKTNPAVLAKVTGIDVRGLNYHLNTLVDMGFLQRRYPVTDTKPTTRSVRYVLDDPLLRFHFCFVFPHLSTLQSLGAEKGFKTCITPGLASYETRCFARLCRLSLPALLAKEGFKGSAEIGEYFDSETLIPISAVRDDGHSDVGLCVWEDVSDLNKHLQDLENLVHRYPNTRNATIVRRLFIRSWKGKGKPSAPGVKITTLTDLQDSKAASTRKA